MTKTFKRFRRIDVFICSLTVVLYSNRSYSRDVTACLAAVPGAHLLTSLNTVNKASNQDNSSSSVPSTDPNERIDILSTDPDKGISIPLSSYAKHLEAKV